MFAFRTKHAHRLLIKFINYHSYDKGVKYITYDLIFKIIPKVRSDTI